ncbi:Ger(x)C family spore germination protein [Paenibacillus mesophilus]|uniref:Ger(x)C family spore germination protein n=1 Tax=Paenibacillus mesophilus TaxID=2582849 RepID=UPI0013051591|nr:Ger(x)C family spore germination protein [Paenibacillus mesophilus]
MKPSRMIVLAAGLSVAMLLTGCWDRTEVNDIAIVLASGIDIDKDGYRVSILVPLPGNMGGASGGGGGSGGNRPYTIDSETGRTVREAYNKLQSRLSRRLFSGHRKVLLIGEEAAKAGLAEMMDIAGRVPENRLTSYIAVTKGKALDVLNATPKLERFSAEALRELLKSDATISIQVKDVVSELSGEGQDALLPYVEAVKTEGSDKPNEELQITGFAYTSGGRMSGIAKGDAATGIRWLKNSFKPYLETVEVEGGLVSVAFRRGQSSMKPYIAEGKIHYRIKIEGEGTIIEAPDGRDYENRNNVALLERQLEHKIRDDLQTVGDIIRKKRTDIPGFGAMLSRTFPGRWRSDWGRNWPSDIRNIQLRVEASVNVNRTGMFSKNISVKERQNE